MLFLIIPLLLIIFEGIFTASETGLVSIENIRVFKAKKEKKKWAIRVSNFLSSPESFFSTINIWENVILVLSSTLFAKFFIEHFGDNGVFLATVILSIYSLTVGQFIPKSIALSNPDKIMMSLSGVIYYTKIITYPVVYLYANISKAIARIFKSDTETDSISRSDIIHAMGEYEKESSRLAARLFNFSKRVVSEVMIPLNAVFSCKKGYELEALSNKYKRIYTRIPVYIKRFDDIIGVFNIKDYFYTDKITLRKPFFINANERCMSIFSTMKQKGEHMAIVRDDNNRVLGIVTLEDLIEELVGEIRDER
jgi:putative hemolysin